MSSWPTTPAGFFAKEKLRSRRIWLKFSSGWAVMPRPIGHATCRRPGKERRRPPMARACTAERSLDVTCDSMLRYRAGQASRFHTDRTPKSPATSRSLLRLVAKKRPNNRPCLSFSIRACQLADCYSADRGSRPDPPRLRPCPCETAAPCNPPTRNIMSDQSCATSWSSRSST
jgi:hypothetical protein